MTTNLFVTSMHTVAEHAAHARRTRARSAPRSPHRFTADAQHMMHEPNMPGWVTLSAPVARHTPIVTQTARADGGDSFSCSLCVCVFYMHLPPSLRSTDQPLVNCV